MADLQRTIEIIFGAVDQTGGAIGSVAGDLNDLRGSVQDIAAPLADVANWVLGAETAVLALGAAIVGSAVSAFDEFDNAVKETGTLFGATDEQRQYLQDGILELSLSSSSSIDQITDALYNAVSATGDWEGSIDFLADANILANAGVSDLNTSVSALTTVLGAYGAGTNEATAYSDAFFVTIQNGKTTLPELNASIGQVAATAAAANVDFETIGAAVASLTVNIGNTSESMTALKALLAALSNPSKELQAAMGGLSLETDGLVPIIEALANSTGGSQAAMAALFGSVEASNAALILANDSSGTFANTLEAMAEKAGKAAEASDQLDESAQNIANAWNVVLIRLGEDMNDSFEGLEGSIKNVFVALASAVENDALSPLTDVVNQVFSGLGESLEGIADALPEALKGVDFTELTGALENALESVGQVLNTLFGDVDLTTVEGLTEAIQRVIDDVTSLTNVAAGIIGSWAPVIEMLRGAADQFNAVDAESQDFVGTILGVAQQIDAFGGILDGLVTALEAVGTGLLALAGASGLQSLVTSLAGASTEAGGLGAVLARLGLGTVATSLGVVAGAVTGVGFALKENSEEWRNQQTLAEAEAEAMDNSATAHERAASVLDQLNERLGTSYGSMQDFNQAVEDGRLVFNEQTAQWEQASQAAGDHGDALDETAQRLRAMVDLEAEFEQAIAQEALNIRDSDAALAAADATKRGYVATTEDGVTTITQYGSALVGTKDKTKELADKTDEAAKKSEEYQLKVRELDIQLEEIASKERIATLEFAADIKVAQIEADAERAVAAFESVSAAIESNNALIGELSGSYLEADSFRDQFFLEDLMEDANQRANEAQETQNKLAEAEIARILAQTEALERGDAMIQIDGSGLAPELEAFMWAILENIRVRANADFQDYLLGMGVEG
jgi:TP901 family phage tail tape measure protein